MSTKNRILLVVIVFLISLIVRLLTINAMGRTFDETPYVEEGYRFITLIKQGDFSNPYWYQNPDHPPLARYVYGYVSQPDIAGFTPQGTPVFHYDYTYARIAAIFLGSLSVLLVIIIGWRYFSFLTGITAGVILSLLPLSVGYTQLATLESFILFFFTLSTFLFLLLLEKPTVARALLTGMGLGAAVMVKQTNGLLLPLFLALLIVWSRAKKPIPYRLLLIAAIAAGLTIFFLWPMPWFHLDEVLGMHNAMWLPKNPLAPPELLFGRFVLAPEFYYVLSFLITTPLVVLLLFFTGVREVFNKKTLYYIAILLWFTVPFLQSFYHFRQHNIRYIFEIYAPLSLLAALGFVAMTRHFTKDRIKQFLLVIPLAAYLLFVLIKASPYYLDYFNLLVGGTNAVFAERLFLLGWWGQGMKETGLYIENNLPTGSKIGLATGTLRRHFPELKAYRVEPYQDSGEYDYVVVSYFNVLREGFDDTKIKNEYTPIYSATADEAPIVTVYKRK